MVSIDEIEKQLKNNKLNSIYLLYGEEKFLLENVIKKIKKNFGELIKGINYIIMEELNVDEIIYNIDTPTMGYEKKLIIMKNLGLLKKDGKKKNIELEKQRYKLNQYILKNLEYINKYVLLLFIEEDIEKKELFKTIDENGTVCEFALQGMKQIEKRLKDICYAYKVNIDSTTLEYLIEECGTSMQCLINEIRKLIEFVGQGGTINKSDIDKLSIKQIQAVIFELTDNLGKKNISKSLEILNNLIYLKEPIQKILVTLYNHFKKIYITKLSERFNKDLLESLNLKPNQKFLINKYKNQAMYFKEKEVRNILSELVKLDADYKNGRIDLNIGLQVILCQYCSK